VADIPIELANRAHAGTSFDPEKRGGQERLEYAMALWRDLTTLAKLATTDEKRATLETEFERYRAGYKQRTIARLQAHARCLSSMITGPSNFPTRRNEKANAAEGKRTDELIEYRTRALAAIRRALCPEDAPIMSGDSNAAARLAIGITAREREQERMKAANAAIRKHAKAGADAQIAALVALDFPAGIAEQLLKPDFAGRIGFADYQIKNNGAEIRRLQARLATVERNQAAPVAEAQGEHARMEDNPADNRVRLYFPGKPDLDVRTRLKRAGFRWAPTLGCWQAYRNTNALAVARDVAGVTE
jgi:hypothetical protein